MKKKVLVLMLTAGMLTSGLAANTFASDSNEEFTQFAEETESTEGMTAESVDSDLDFVDAGEAKETEESGDIFSDTEDFTTGTEISDADSSGAVSYTHLVENTHIPCIAKSIPINFSAGLFSAAWFSLQNKRRCV